MRVGIFVDAENVKYNSEHRIRFDILREFAGRGGNEVIISNMYMAVDESRAVIDKANYKSVMSYHDLLRDQGWTIKNKKVKWYSRGENNLYSKANSDIEIVVDAMNSCKNLDKIILVTGDGDFVYLINYLQSIGKIVEVIGFKNVSSEIRRESNLFISGFLIPNIFRDYSETPKKYGVCMMWNPENKNGFIKYISDLEKNLFVHDTRDERSAYSTLPFNNNNVRFPINELELPDRHIIFSFTENRNNSDKLFADQIELVVNYNIQN